MAYRPLEVTVISAKDLSNVNLFSKMDVYAVAMLSGDTRSRKKSSVDREGGKNPTWNFTFKFTVMEFDADRAVLTIVLKSERTFGDREIGEVHVPIRELLDGWKRAVAGGSSSGGAEGKKAVSPAQFVSYQVRKHSGKAKGVLNISYKFGDLVSVAPQPQYVADPAAAYAAAYTAANHPPAGPAYPPPGPKPTHDPATAYPPQDAKPGPEPVTAYPVGPSGASSAYPPSGAYPYPPQPGYSYPQPPHAGYGTYPPPASYPPQPGYGYPPQQGGYGYPRHHSAYGYPPQQGGYGYAAPVVQPQQPKKSKLGGAGAGLGLGLLGGALGGMILGDMVSDAAAYDAGYDTGFDDGFGF